MIMALFDTGSVLLNLDPPLLEVAGVEAVEYEDRIAEIAVGRYRRQPSHMWLYSDAREVACEAVDYLSSQVWSDIDRDTRRLLIAGALEVLRQVVPVSQRLFYAAPYGHQCSESGRLMGTYSVSGSVRSTGTC